MSALFSPLAPRNWSGRKQRGLPGLAGLAHADRGCQAALRTQEKGVSFSFDGPGRALVAGDLCFLLGHLGSLRRGWPFSCT